jgi:outer membrane protein OmpA-like peptidoglycan-associated protein
MPYFTRLLLSAALMAGTWLPAPAQNVPFTSDGMKNPLALKAAQKLLKNGEEHYAAAPPRYAAALPLFLEAHTYNSNNAALNLRIGDCYLNLGDKATALPFLQKAVALETHAAPRTHYVLARAYQLTAKWPEAIKEYERAKPVAVGPAKKGQRLDATSAEVNRRIAECKAGQYLMLHPVRVFIDNLGPGLNSAEADYRPVVTADGSSLFLTSRRPGSLGGEKAAAGQGFTADIYQALWDGNRKTWGPARNPNAPVNSSGQDATVAISPDGQRLLLHADNDNADLSETRLTASGWSKPKPLGSHINSKHQETSATYSPDGRYLYFVSDKPEGSLGGRDIYRAEIDGRTPPQNLGSTINTPYDEEGVFMQPDGKTLYFSSQGHGTMGGFDIFKSVYKNGMWSAPENLGWPINTPEDDIFFVTSASGRAGFYASERAGGLGGQDIYQVTFLGPEKQPMLSQQDRLLASHQRHPITRPRPVLTVPVVTPELTLLKGVVTDVASLRPLQAQIDVIDNATGQTISTCQSTTAGKFMVSLPAGTNYGLVVRHEDYLFHSENFNLPASAGYVETMKDIRLQKMEPGSNIVLANVFFDPGKAILRPESTAELERLLKLLNDSPRLRLHLCGHTDNSGPADASQELSESRAQAVRTYLVDHKVKADRLLATGYGATIPIAPNTTEAGRQLNQRIAFKVLSR